MSGTEREQIRWVAAGLIPFLLGGLYPLQVRIDRQIDSVAVRKDELLLQSPALVKRLSLGYESLVANIYWTRAVQYYGTKHLHEDPDYRLLAPLLDMTTTLDPQLVVAYKFGAVFLAQGPPQGAGRPDLAVDLLRRGIAANPQEWRLWVDLGFVYYWDMKDYKKAAEAYIEGSRRPGAAPWMKPMAATLAAQGGSRDTSRFLWSEVYQSTSDPLIKKNAWDHLQTLRAEEDVEHLEKLAADFRARYGRFPSSLQELVATGMLPGVPVDPAGFPYVLGPDGTAHLNPASRIPHGNIKPLPQH